MIILGIDPGVAIVGFGVIEYSGSKFRTLDYGVITTPAHTDTEKRLATIYRELKDTSNVFSPELVSCLDFNILNAWSDIFISS